MGIDKLITIGKFSQTPEAHIVKGKLESMGVECFLQDQHLVSINWLYSNAIGGVKLQVKSSDVPRAFEILSKHQGSHPKKMEDNNKTEFNCPKCNSDEVQFGEFSKKLAFITWLFLTVPLIKKKWKCNNCDFQWKK